jgi:type II secretory pathway component PulF
LSVFAYKAVNADGRLAEGFLEAADSRGAVVRLESMGLVPVSVEESTVGRQSTGWSPLARRVSRKDVLYFTEEFATLVHAGLPLDRSLDVAANLTPKPALREAIRDILKQIKSGKSVSEAFAAHPRYFSSLYVNMLRAGEAGGVLDAVMARLVEFERAADELRSYLTAALIYPMLMLAVGTGSVAILLYFVIPKFATIFSDIGAAIPPETQFLLWLSAMTRHYWWVLAGGIAAAVMAFRSWRKTPKGSRAWDAFKLRVPLLGQTILKIEVSRFARTLGTLLSSAVPLISGVRIVQGIARNQLVAEGISRIADGAKRGEGVSKPMRESGVFPLLALHMVEVGEETGRLDAMLLQVADVYEKEVRASVKALTAVFEPVIILVMGVLIGTVVLSMLSAIFSINEVGF